MARLNYFIYALLVLVILVLLAREAGISSLDDLTAAAQRVDIPPAAPPAAQPAVKPALVSFKLGHVQAVLANVQPRRRQALLENAEAFRDFVRQEAANQSLLAAARSSNLEQDENTRFLMQRTAENVLVEVYLNRLINNRIPADFPTEEQLREYYEENKQNLVLEERMHVWQIFLPVAAGAEQQGIDEVRNRVEQLVTDLREGKIDFSGAAYRHSGHQASRNNGGYMGLLKVSELIPVIHEALSELDEGEISDPVRSDTGFHILRRGATVPAREVTFEEVRDQIANLLTNQVRARLQNAVREQAATSFPVNLDEETIEAWRQRLLPPEQPAAPD